jgi:hypothetical protein
MQGFEPTLSATSDPDSEFQEAMSAAPGPAHSPAIEPSSDHRLDVFLYRSRAVRQQRVGEGETRGRRRSTAVIAAAWRVT